MNLTEEEKLSSFATLYENKSQPQSYLQSHYNHSSINDYCHFICKFMYYFAYFRCCSNK